MHRKAKTGRLTFNRFTTGICVVRGPLDAAALNYTDQGIIFSFVAPTGYKAVTRAYTLAIGCILLRQWRLGQLPQRPTLANTKT